MTIKQVKTGLQPRVYADHEWEWIITLEEGETLTQETINQLLEKAYIGKAMKRDDYWKAYRDKNLSFDEHMGVVCKGYYWVSDMDANTKCLSARQEYID